MRWFRDERGQVLVMTVFSMGILLGAMGLAVDVGVLLHARRHIQAVADAAAMAGATELFYNGSANVGTKVYAAALANGVDQSAAGNTVNYTVGPTLADGSTCSSCVLAVVATKNHTIFMDAMSDWVFQSKNYDSVNVAAKGVAGSPGISKFCMYVMDPTDPDTLQIHGAANINAPNCAVYVNSNNTSPGAFCTTGGAGKSTAAGIAVVGTQDLKGNCKGNPGPPVWTGSGVESPSDLAKLPADPTKSCSSVTDLASSGGVLTAAIAAATAPGYGGYACYTDSATTKGSITPVSLSTNLGPGNFVFETGLTLSGTVQVGNGTGTTTSPSGGATIIITGSGAFDSSSASNFSVYAPADPSALYNGVAIYQPSSDTSAMNLQFGSSSSYFMGAVVAPSSYVTLHDQGGAVTATNLIVGQAYVNGTVNFQNYNTYNPNTTPFRVITMVE
jgi:Flp pilus assembly protein TadG